MARKHWEGALGELLGQSAGWKEARLYSQRNGFLWGSLCVRGTGTRCQASDGEPDCLGEIPASSTTTTTTIIISQQKQPLQGPERGLTPHLPGQSSTSTYLHMHLSSSATLPFQVRRGFMTLAGLQKVHEIQERKGETSLFLADILPFLH